MELNIKIKEISLEFPYVKLRELINKIFEPLLIFVFVFLSIFSFLHFSSSGVNLSYNDAMSHLDIARRVFDNLQPGLTQLGSVWLPLPHLLMLPFVWNDFLWHSGLAGGIVSMLSYVICCFFTYKSVKFVTQNRMIAAFCSLVVALNLNFLYLQTTALTEPLFMGLFSMLLYFILRWQKSFNVAFVVIMGVIIGLMTMTRYDAWFILIFITLGIFIINYFRRGRDRAEGQTILFVTVAVLGILIWFLYNYIIFGDAFYFALGEYSAKAQQNILLNSGVLKTKGNFMLSVNTYIFAMIDNVGICVFIASILGTIYFFYKRKSIEGYMVGLILLSIVIFNILALYFGFSVIYVPEITGNSWFNVRYGLLYLPVAAIFIGYLINSKQKIFYIIVPILIFLQIGLFFMNQYAVTITDGTVGSSQKNVRPIGKIMGELWSEDHGYILASVASHDAILFASNIPMSQFIHEGARKYWDPALRNPETMAKYIIMRTNDRSDSVAREMIKIKDFNKKYKMVYDGDFADIYKRIK